MVVRPDLKPVVSEIEKLLAAPDIMDSFRRRRGAGKIRPWESGRGFGDDLIGLLGCEFVLPLDVVQLDGLVLGMVGW